MLVALTGAVSAGGLFLNEFGTTSMGNAGAGAQAYAKDASTTLHNPAGMTRIKGQELLIGGGFLASKVEFDPDRNTPIPGGDGGNAGGPAPLLGAFYVRELNDAWWFGLALSSISGAVLDYDDDWAGRYLAQEVSLLSLTLAPSLAYRVNDWLSLGVAGIVTYGVLEMDVAFPPPTGTGQIELEDLDDTAFAFAVGALLEVSDRTRIGLAYVDGPKFEFSGDIKINPLGVGAGIDTDLDFADFLRLGIYHQLNDKVELVATLGWDGWSSLDNQFVATARGSTNIPRNWDDTYRVGFGINYRLDQRWLLQTGVMYDSSPVNARDRTADLPIDRQVRLAFGAQYQLRKNLLVGGAFVYADYGNAKIENSLLVGEYDHNDIFFFAINANWRF